MSRMTECGNLPPAQNNRQPYCPVCDALFSVDREAPNAEEQIDAIFDKLDRIHKLRTAYGRRRR